MLNKTTVFVIRFYQNYVSSLKRPACRFSPTCSEYTRLAVLKYGFFKGCMLGFLRLIKCHPFHSGGYDPLT
ncbi:membrane protein insertion efficiency factor YidD [bacterium]|nr:membrane protein insertion efficiency factor YidD [bacterium]